tara:strand:+ start:1630 stop:2394 length:765 start_codon:yes stop_codon:yes gene_type:complete
MINKESYVTANFIDAERKNIEVLLNLGHTEEMHLTPLVIEANEDNSDYQDLLKLVTVDQLHEQTWETKKQESQAFMSIAQQIAKDTFAEEEMKAIANIDTAEMIAGAEVDASTLLTKTKIYPTIVDTIFSNMENEDHLFALKLALFEVQEIRESKNIKAKTALRKGKNKIEVLTHAFEIVGVRKRTDDDKSISTPAANDAELEKVEATPQKAPAAGVAKSSAAVKISPTTKAVAAKKKNVAATKKSQAAAAAKA